MNNSIVCQTGIFDVKIHGLPQVALSNSTEIWWSKKVYAKTHQIHFNYKLETYDGCDFSKCLVDIIRDLNVESRVRSMEGRTWLIVSIKISPTNIKAILA